MAINPNIALAVKQPEVQGPLPAFQQTLALKSMLDSQAMNQQLMRSREQEMRLKEQEINENTIKAQQLKRGQDGLEAYTQAVRDNTKEEPGKGFPTDWDKVTAKMRASGFPDMADTIDAHRADFEAKKNENIKNALSNETSLSQRAYGLFADVPTKKPEEQEAAYNAAAQQLSGMKNLPQNMVKMPPQWDAANPQTALDAIGQLRNVSLSHEQKLAEIRSAEETAKNAAELKKTGVETGAAQAKADAEQIASYNKDQFMQKKADDEDFRKRHPGEFDTEHKSAVDYLRSTHPPSATLNQQQDYLAAFQDPAKMKALGIDPAQGHTADAAGYAKWINDVQAQKIVKEQQALTGTGEFGKGPFKNTPPKLVAQATAAHTKAFDNYTTAKAASDNLQSALDQAASGNKFAAKQLATMATMDVNVSEGIRRVNMAEIANSVGAGNAWDRVKGWFGGLTEGQPMPENIRKDVEQLEKAIQKNSMKQYNDRVTQINNDYTAEVPLLSLPSEKGEAPSGESVTISGKQYKVGDTAPNGKPIVAIKGNSYATAK